MSDLGRQMTIFDMMYDLYKIKKPVRLIELFAGYGSQAFALNYLGVNYESYKICEWNFHSFKAYKEFHHNNDHIDYSKDMTKEQVLDCLLPLGISRDWNEPMKENELRRMNESQLREIYNNIQATHNLVDISRARGKDFEIENEREREKEYVMTYSFPCFTANQLVLTKEYGYIPFIELKEGMSVLSHDCQFHKITSFYNQGLKNTIHIKAMQFDDIECTENHKFYARKRYRYGHIQKRYFKEPEWIEAKDLTKDYYLGTAIINEEKEYYTNDLDFWYVIGAYLGDGWVNSNTKDTIICGNEKKINFLKEKFDNLKIRYTINQDSKHCYRLRTHNKDLRTFVLNNIDVGSGTKHISYDIMALPKQQLESFFNGYLNSDGCIVKNNYQFTTINKNIVSSMVAIINKLFHSPCKVYKSKRNATHIIENRIVHQNDTYLFRFKKEVCKQDKAFYENGYIWYPIKEITKGNTENVFDIAVEDTHSFVLDNCIVHNCQDLSLAGTKSGMRRNSNTRSGLLWEVERILKELTELKQRPNILIMENVPQVHGAGNEEDFNDWIKSLDEMGYTSYWQDLIATDYGIPQTRNRCFMVSILGKYNYHFPLPKPLKLKLSDLLEDNVDSKYFLSSAMLNYMLDENTKNYNRKEVFERNYDKLDKGIASTISTRAGMRPTNNFIINNKAVRETLEMNKDEIKENTFIDGYNRAVHQDMSNTITAGIAKRNNQFVVKKQNTELCDNLIQNGIVKENDIIKHSRATHPLDYLDYNDCMPCLTTRPDTIGITTKDTREESLKIRNATKQGYLEGTEGDGVDISKRMKYHRGNVQKDKCQTLKTQNDVGVIVSNKCEVIGGVGEKKSNGGTQYYNQDRIYDSEQSSPSLTTSFNPYYSNKSNLGIRKLTPRECFRLMGVKDEDFDKIKDKFSDMVLYHLAGDSIVVNVLMAIFSELF